MKINSMKFIYFSTVMQRIDRLPIDESRYTGKEKALSRNKRYYDIQYKLSFFFLDTCLCACLKRSVLFYISGYKLRKL